MKITLRSTNHMTRSRWRFGAIERKANNKTNDIVSFWFTSSKLDNRQLGPPSFQDSEREANEAKRDPIPFGRGNRIGD